MLQPNEQLRELKEEWNKTKFTNNIWENRDVVDVMQDEIFDWWLNKIEKYHSQGFQDAKEKAIASVPEEKTAVRENFGSFSAYDNIKALNDSWNRCRSQLLTKLTNL